MAKTVDVGVVVTSDTKGLKKGLDLAGKSLKKLRKGLEKSEKKTGKFGKSFAGVVVGIGASVAVFKSISGAIGGFVSASMDMRAETDKSKQSIGKMKASFSGISSAIGDVLVPMLAGIADAIKPGLDAFKQWIAANKEFIQGKIVEYLTKIALTLTKFVAKSVIGVVRVWKGWDMAILTTKSVFQSMTAATLRSVAKIVGAITKLNAALGRDEAAARWKRDREELNKTAKAYEDKADRNMAAAAQSAKELEDLEKKIKKIEASIAKGIGDAGKAMLKRMKAEVVQRKKDHKKENEAAKKAAEERQKILDAAAERAQARRDAMRKKAVDAEKARVEELKQLATAAGSVVINSLGTALSEIEAGTKSAKHAFQDMAKTIFKELLKIAAQKALLALVSTIGSGGMGGIAAGAAGLVGSALRPTKMNSGGYVKGYASGGGVDSVRAMLTPGEYVLPKALVDNIRLGQAPARANYATGGMVASMGVGAMTAPINVSMNTFAVPSRGEFRRWYKSSVAPNTKKMAERGQL